MENLEHLLKLSDEYEVKLVFEPCTKFVRDQSITRGNVMKLLAIADLYGLDDVRQGCNNLLKNMRLKTLSETVHLEDLDLAKTRHFLEQRIERLEEFLDVVYPQLMGLVSWILWLMNERNKDVSWCTNHFPGGRYMFSDHGAEGTCKSCGEMLQSVVRNYYCGSKYKIDESLPSIIGEFCTLKNSD